MKTLVLHRNPFTMLALFVFFTTTAHAADHQHCFKIKDSADAELYSANLVPTDPAFAAATGCEIKVPAKLLCIDVDKTSVSPTPPGAAPGQPAQKSLCYKVKCPKFESFGFSAADQFGEREVSVSKSSLLCAPIPTTTTTTLPSGCVADNDCEQLPNATVVCTAGDCVFGSCDPGFADCNSLAADGCEVAPASDIGNCNACGNICSVPPNASAATCVGGVCGMAACNPGFADCNSSASDGCETPTSSDASNCGACGNVCPAPPNGGPGCISGTCGIGSCDLTYEDCNSNPVDGCEASTLDDVNNCGNCGNVCPTPANAAAGCITGACGIGSCDPGFTDCNINPVDGCEVSLGDPNNCGGCGNVCPLSAPNCFLGTCLP